MAHDNWDAAVVLLHDGVHHPWRDWIEVAQGLALLRAEGFSATGHYLRTQAQRDQFAASLHQSSPRVVLLHVGAGQVAAAQAFLNVLPQVPAHTTIAIAGSIGTLCSHEFITHRNAGAVLLGQWVETLVEYLQTLRAAGNLDLIGGLWWRSPHGWKLTGRRIYDPNLEDWPDAEIRDFRAEELFRLHGGEAIIHASRGFPFQSLFTAEPILRSLQVSERYYHLRPAHRIVREAEKLVREFKVTRFRFVDEIFPWDDTWTMSFAMLWKKHIDLPFEISTAADHLTPARTGVLKKAGLAGVEVCLEAGNEPLRRRLSDLNQSNKQLFETLDACHEMGLATRVRLLLGVPGETVPTLRESVQFADACDAREVRAEVYQPWPESKHWAELEKSLTGHTMNRMVAREQAAIARDVVIACHEIQAIDSVKRSERMKRKADVTLDALADFPLAKLRSPLEGAVRLARFHAPTGSHEVIALRVPTELAYKVRLPKNPVLSFGLLLEPLLPGERSRLPISFSIKISQGKRTWRLFQKVLIQGLDPDSRLWHWFKIPISGVKAGEAEFMLENLVYGQDATAIPPGRDVWAGWTRVYLTTETNPTDAEATDEVLMGGAKKDRPEEPEE